MAKEIRPLDNAMEGSRQLGVKFAEHLANKGGIMKGDTWEQTEFYLPIFNDLMQKAWTERYGKPPTQIEQEALEEAFGRSFYMMLGSITR